MSEVVKNLAFLWILATIFFLAGVEVACLRSSQVIASGPGTTQESEIAERVKHK